MKPQKYKYYQATMVENQSQTVHLQVLGESCMKLDAVKGLLVVFVAETQTQNIETDFELHSEITFDDFDKVNQKFQK